MEAYQHVSMLFVRGFRGPAWTPQLPHVLAAPKNVNMFRTELTAISPELPILECQQRVTFLTNVTNTMALRMSPSLSWNEKTALRCFMPPCMPIGPHTAGELLLPFRVWLKCWFLHGSFPNCSVALLSPSMFSLSFLPALLKYLPH